MKIVDGYFSAAKLSVSSGGGGDYGIPDIAKNVFDEMTVDRVAQAAAGKSNDTTGSVLPRLHHALAVPKCQSKFTAGTSRSGPCRKDVTGVFGSVCVHSISDHIFGNIFVVLINIISILNNQ